MPVLEGGQYFLIFETDADNPLNEADILNNAAVIPIEVALSIPPDLAVTDFQSPKLITGPANPTIQLVWRVVNQGLGPTTGSWSDTVLLFTNLNSAPAAVLGRFSQTKALAVREDYWRSETLSLPLAQSATFYLSLRANSENDMYELDTNNNEALAHLTFILIPPALRVSEAKINDDGSFELMVHGSIGSGYLLQSSSDLVNWVGVCQFTCTNSPVWVQAPASTNSAQRFYRVMQ
jgi:subtilase family serine protease